MNHRNDPLVPPLTAKRMSFDTADQPIAEAELAAPKAGPATYYAVIEGGQVVIVKATEGAEHGPVCHGGKWLRSFQNCVHSEPPKKLSAAIFDGVASVVSFGTLGIEPPQLHKKYCRAGFVEDADNISQDFAAFDRAISNAVVKINGEDSQAGIIGDLGPSTLSDSGAWYHRYWFGK